MNSSVLELIIRAKDEAAQAIASVHQQLSTLADKANVGGRAMGAFGDILKGVAMGIGIQAFMDLQNVFDKLAGSIPDLISKGLSFADTTHQLSLDTGASAEQSSRLLGIFDFLGVSTDGLSMRIGMFSKNVVAHAAYMSQLGIATTDANGHMLDTITILDNARQAFQAHSDGVNKAADAMKLFGRAGLEMLPYLSLTNEQVAALNTEMDTLGVTMNQSGVIQAKAVSQEFNLFGLSVQGVANKLLNDVGPALMQGVQMIADWVSKNGTAIANFASNVVNFVMGMISALTGASFSAVSFAGSLGALGGTASTTADQMGNLGGATKANTKAIDEQTKAVDAQIASLKSLETEQDKQFAKQMSALDAGLSAQAKAIDAKAAAHRLDEQTVSLANQLADAQANLAAAQAGKAGVVDPKAVEAAADQVTQIQQQQADLQTTIADDARKAQLTTLSDFIKATQQAETDAVDKKKWAETEKKQVTVLQSQIAAAQASGDTQSVSDLTVQLEAVQTAVKKAELDKRNADRMSDLDKQKAQLADLKAAASAAGSAVGSSIASGAATGGAAISKMSGDAKVQLGGVGGAFSTALAAGQDFGAKMRAIFGDIATTIGNVTTGVLGVASAISGLHISSGEITMIGMGLAGLAVATANLPLALAAIGLISMGSSMGATPSNQYFAGVGVGPGVSRGFGTAGGPGSTGNRDAQGHYIGPGISNVPGAATGGYVGQTGVAIIHKGETITPAGQGGGSINFGPGSIVVHGILDATLADQLALQIKRSLTRESTSFSSGY